MRIVVLTLCLVVLAPLGHTQTPDRPDRLVIISAYLHHLQGYDSEPRFNFLKQGTLIREQRAQGTPTLLVDHSGFRTQEVHRDRLFMNLISLADFDAIGVVNGYNISYEPDVLYELLSAPGLNPICANLRDARGNLLFPESRIVTTHGLKVGITAFTDPEGLRRFRGHREIDGYTAEDAETALQRVVPRLARECDVVVVMTNYVRDRMLPWLSRLEDVDVVLAGSVTDSTVTGGPPIVKTEPWSRIELDLESGALHVEGMIPDASTGEDPELRAGWDLMRAANRDHDKSKKTAMQLGLSNPFRLEEFGAYDTHSRKGVHKKIKGSIRGRQGRSVSFSWEYPLDPPEEQYELSWQRPHLLWVRIRTDPRMFVVPESGLLESGSRTETLLIELLRRTTDRYFSILYQDSLSQVYSVTSPDREQMSVLRSYTPGQEKALRLLALARFLEQQVELGLTEKPRYWHRRGLVYLNLRCRQDGRVQEVTVLENNAYPSAADSLVEIWEDRILTPPDWREREPREFRRPAVGTIDPGESTLGDLIPPSPPIGEDDLVKAGLMTWFQTLKMADPSISMDFFVGDSTLSLDSEDLPRQKSPRIHRNMLRWGVLQPSPGREWQAQFITVTSKGVARIGPNRAFRIFNEGSDEGLMWSGADQDYQIGNWLNESQLLIVGWSRIEHPRHPGGQWMEFTVPSMWLVDVEQRSVCRYRGAPIPLDRVSETIRATRKIQQEFYSGVKWE